jgi:hypothetical protein
MLDIRYLRYFVSVVDMGILSKTSQSSFDFVAFAQALLRSRMRGRFRHRRIAIGAVGSTSRSTSPRLRFETRIYGEAVDPQNFLRGQRAAECGLDPRATGSLARIAG